MTLMSLPKYIRVYSDNKRIKTDSSIEMIIVYDVLTA